MNHPNNTASASSSTASTSSPASGSASATASNTATAAGAAVAAQAAGAAPPPDPQPVPEVSQASVRGEGRAATYTKHPRIMILMQLTAIISCGYGLWTMWTHSDLITAWSLRLGSFWFGLGIVSNISGAVGLYKHLCNPESDDSESWVRRHYILAWLQIVMGYPNFVIMTWMSHYPTNYVYTHLILGLMPIYSWCCHAPTKIVRVTQGSSIFTILSHLYISYLAWQKWGFAGVALMIFNVSALSIPTRYHLFGIISSREMYVVGLTATSFVFAMEVASTAQNPVKVSSLKLWG